ncbi:MAG: MotA/TolQ/ExbB proton channel family protein [Phycisphaerae bacterium]
MGKQRAVMAGVMLLVVLLASTGALGEEAVRRQRSFAEMAWDATWNTWIGFFDIFAIFGLSLTAVALIIEHGITIRRVVLLPELSVAQVKTMFDERRFREALEFCQADPSFVSGVVHAGLVEAANGYEAMERAMQDAAEERTSRLYRKIEYLNLIGNVSPMLGLFGTVYGMMVAFAKIETLRSPDASELAGGILTALFSTFAGLFVAIPALSAYAIYRNRIEQLSMEAALVAEELLANFKPTAAA